MKRIIVAASVDSIELDLWNIFEEDPDACLMYDVEWSPYGSEPYYHDTYTIRNTESGMKMIRNRFHIYSDNEDVDVVAAGSYSVAKVVSKIQPDLTEWQHARITLDIHDR